MDGKRDNTKQKSKQPEIVCLYKAGNIEYRRNLRDNRQDKGRN